MSEGLEIMETKIGQAGFVDQFIEEKRKEREKEEAVKEWHKEEWRAGNL